MNSGIRAFVQERYELKILRSMISMQNIHTALEIGCGNGNGARLIKKYFAPETIIAIDLDETMIAKARKRTADPSISFKVMDAAHLDFPDGRFDAIFDFGIIHHIPDWRECLRELKRVLKPRGELIIEDLSLDSFSTGIGRLWKALSAHPYERMYRAREFMEFLKELGFTIRSYQESNPLKLVRFFSLNAAIDTTTAGRIS
ncbi:MAG: class I SAM-dependent methyltransferase [Spirochaetes bacterium]|nr:class I SAM-dependent methyltransferase [Spirochaetota bacterium]